jgi:hypothetical protein
LDRGRGGGGGRREEDTNLSGAIVTVVYSIRHHVVGPTGRARFGIGVEHEVLKALVRVGARSASVVGHHKPGFG